MRTLATLALLAVSSVFAAGCAAETGADNTGTSSADEALRASTISNIALANLGRGACSTNSAGGRYYDSSCTGNGGQPEYWCADFARWVWAHAGVTDTSRLNAAAGSFYLYGEAHGTIHHTPRVGDAAVFNYHGGGSADHVAIVSKVNANGSFETVSGDWGGRSGSEAYFSSTSHVVLNPTYTVATAPQMTGMSISAFVSPAGSVTYGGGSSGGTTNPAGCYSGTLGREMPANACVQSKFDDAWYQCNSGTWVDRWTDPAACNGVYPL